jgi:hypothetical protein
MQDVDGKPRRKETLVNPGHRLKDNLKISQREI